MHVECSLWSHGVRVRKDEPDSEEAKDETESEMLARRLENVETTVLKAALNKCAHCKHYGASLKCKASGRFYHHPCAAASGSFMQKGSYLFVGADSLGKVASYGECRFFVSVSRDRAVERFTPIVHHVTYLTLFLSSSHAVDKTATYLIHNGVAWKYEKIWELPADRFENLLFCTKCGQHYFYTGMHVRITPVIRAGWQCQKCKWCQICRASNHEDTPVPLKPFFLNPHMLF